MLELLIVILVIAAATAAQIQRNIIVKNGGMHG